MYNLCQWKQKGILKNFFLNQININVVHELEDVITDIDVPFHDIVRLRKQYEIEDEDEKDILKNRLKVKYIEKVISWSKNKKMNKTRKKNRTKVVKNKGVGDEEGDSKEDEINHLMTFMLQLESVAVEDDKAYIERLWE